LSAVAPISHATHCCICGVSTLNLRLKGAGQMHLIITPYEPEIVDLLDLAPFIDLLLRIARLRHSSTPSLRTSF
jgi:hypothetical protein